MIEYTSAKQISIEDFSHPFGGTLNKENRWVVLAGLLPWDELVSVYAKKMSHGMGRKAVNPRVAIGALIIKHTLSATDEDTIEFIKENPYLQYFLGYDTYSYEQPFTASLFVSIRRRLGTREFDRMTDHLMNRVERTQQKLSQKKGKDNSEPPGGKTAGSGGEQTRKTEDPAEKGEEKLLNKGHLIVDATAVPADIKYPTDLDLLNEARENSEYLIDLLYEPSKGKIKPRTYRNKARKDYLSAIRQRKKRKKNVGKAVKSQLNYLRRNVKTIESLLDEKEGRHFPLAYKHQKRYWVIQELYRQQRKMYEEKTHKIPDRIVSISQPHVRPIVRGKAGKEVEFGTKEALSLVEGYIYRDRVDWDAFNEGKELIGQIEKYKVRFGLYPEWVSGDKIYGNRENREYMKSHGIKYSGVALGRPRKSLTPEEREQEKERKRISRQRSEIEGRFGVGKRRYDLDPVKAKTKETSESWIGMVYLVMNIAQFQRAIFWPLFKTAIFLLKKLKKTFQCTLIPLKPQTLKFRFATF